MALIFGSAPTASLLRGVAPAPPREGGCPPPSRHPPGRRGAAFASPACTTPDGPEGAVRSHPRLARAQRSRPTCAGAGGLEPLAGERVSGAPVAGAERPGAESPTGSGGAAGAWAPGAAGLIDLSRD